MNAESGRLATVARNRQQQHMMKKGDFIYYKTKEFGLWPAVVEMVGKRWLRIEGPTGKMIWVSKSNCQLQEDWRKENEQ